MLGASSKGPFKEMYNPTTFILVYMSMYSNHSLLVWGSTCSLMPMCLGGLRQIRLTLGILNLPFLVYSTGPLISGICQFRKEFHALPLILSLSSIYCFLSEPPHCTVHTNSRAYGDYMMITSPDTVILTLEVLMIQLLQVILNNYTVKIDLGKVSNFHCFFLNMYCYGICQHL